MRSSWSYFVLTGILVGCVLNVHAIATDDNTISADDPANYGYSLDWDYIYNYKGSSAVAVDHYWILTAAHVADDTVNSDLIIGGETYMQQGSPIFHPTADLALVRYDKPFPGYYLLHDDVIHNGKNGPQRVWDTLLLTGYGRTGVVTSVSFGNGPGGNGTKRWGTNRGVGQNTYIVDMGGTVGVRDSECFITEFDLSDTPYEAGAAQFDSGGPVFIERNGDWYLAGTTILIIGSNPSYSGNVMVETSIYRDWIIDNIPDYDSDMDGLPDWWELQYGPDETSLEPDDDSLDGDGFTNYEEWVADTVPDDGNSYLRVTALTSVPEIVFDSSTNRKYQIEYRVALADTNEAWQTEVAWFQPASTQTVQSVSSLTGTRVYRVRAKLR